MFFDWDRKNQGKQRGNHRTYRGLGNWSRALLLALSSSLLLSLTSCSWMEDLGLLPSVGEKQERPASSLLSIQRPTSSLTTASPTKPMAKAEEKNQPSATVSSVASSGSTTAMTTPPSATSATASQTDPVASPPLLNVPSLTPTAGVHYVTFTFDDGPHAQNSNRLLDALAARNLKASFFVVGERLQQPALMQTAMREVAEGHLLCNHSYNHPDLSQLSTADISNQLSWTDQLIAQASGQAAPFLRPPYGSFDQRVVELARRPLLLWNIDPRDWAADATEDSIIQSILQQLATQRQYTGGSIVLLHDIHTRSVNAAIRLFDLLPQYGYQIVSLPEFFGLVGRQPQAGDVLYSQAS